MINNDGDLITSFLKNKSGNTQENYGRWIREWLAFGSGLFTKPFSIKDVDYLDLCNYQDHLGAQKSKLNTVTVKLRCILSLLAWAKSFGYITHNHGMIFAKEADLHREPTVQQKIVSQSTMQMILDNEPNEYYRLFLKTLYAMGLRVSEGIGIDISKVFTRGDRQFIPIIRKGGKVEDVYMPETIYLQLTDVTTGKPFPFDRFKAHSIAKAAGTRVGVPEFSPHFCRHAFGSHSMENGSTLAETMAGLGHKCPTSTQVYMHASKQAADYLDIGDKKDPGLELVG